MQTLYAYKGTNIIEFRRGYSQLVRQEYYDGELDADAATKFDLVFQKALSYPISLLRVITRSGISFRRSQHHIRANKIGVRVLWFVRRGALRITRSRGACMVGAGSCVILDSGEPFHAHATTEEGGAFDAIQAIIPAQLFLEHLSCALEFDAAFEIASEHRQVINKLTDLLFGEGEQMSRKAAEPLVASFLETISDNISELAGFSARQNIVEKRLSDIEAYIMTHLTDPDLTYNEVAAKCGISPRYLCYLLRSHNTSFSTLLWSQRLAKSREWLISDSMQNYPIFQIAFMAGFKSAAHFSRMFKAVYGIPPKEYRTNILEARRDEPCVEEFAHDRAEVMLVPDAA